MNTGTVMWRTGVKVRRRPRTAHALTYGTRRTACGLNGAPFLYVPTSRDPLCRPCACAIDEHAFGGEDPRICQDGESR
jgi:hypothetical protein